jgi:hypothetical protein
MTTVKYSLDEFVSDMESLLRDQPDYQQIFDTGASWLEKLLRNPEAIPGAFRLPVGRRPSSQSRLLFVVSRRQRTAGYRCGLGAGRSPGAP